MSRYSLAISVALLFYLVLAGCATGRSVLRADIDPGHNPPQGTAVRIDTVRDARVFTARPPSAEHEWNESEKAWLAFLFTCRARW